MALTQMAPNSTNLASIEIYKNGVLKHPNLCVPYDSPILVLKGLFTLTSDYALSAFSLLKHNIFISNKHLLNAKSDV